MALHKTTCSIENVMTEILSIDTVVVDVIFLLGKKKRKYRTCLVIIFLVSFVNGEPTW